MLQYKNHRFYWGPVSFEIPEGFYLADNADLEMQIGVFLISPSKDYTLDISICDDTSASAREELESVIRDFTVLESMSEITVNGLHGFQAAYCTKCGQYYEIQIDIPGGTLDLIFKSEKKSILEVKSQINLDTVIFNR